MINIVLAEFAPAQLLITVLMMLFVLIGICALVINNHIQIRVSLLMDNECRVYNRNGLAKYMKRKRNRFKHPNLINVKIVNLGYFYTTYADKDKMMMQIADVMLKGLSRVETLGRVEFNEFMLLVEDLNKDQLREKCKNISNALSELYFENYGVYNFKVEFGVYEDPDIKNYQESIDRCLATIKYSDIRQNNIWYYSEDVSNKLQKLANVNDLKMQALQSKQFAAYIQPKVEYKTGRICGGEILVRWVDEEHRVIFYPDDFIPLFEQTGFIKKLDFVMFEQTCALAQTLKQKGYLDVVLSVNISKINFDSPTFIDDITDIIRKYPGISPSDIEIEITESANMEGSQHLSSIIMNLRQLGYKLAMDDFGKDYATLGSLVNCPYDTIKMDMFFFRNRLSTDKERDIATNVLNLLSKLNVEIVCEGIEDENTINILGTVTHEFVIQGYFVSKPIPISQFEAFLPKKFEFEYPDIVVSKEAAPSKATSAKSSAKHLENDEITQLKYQLEQMKNLFEQSKKQSEYDSKQRDLDMIRDEIRRLKNENTSTDDFDYELQRLRQELSSLKTEKKRNEYLELQRQIDELKNMREETYRENVREPQTSAITDAQIALIIERLKNANREQFDKFKEENEKKNENILAELEKARKEREKLEQLLSQKDNDEEDSLSEEEIKEEQERANEALDLNIDSLSETDDDEEDEDDDFKPSLTQEEVDAIINQFKEKYNDDWIDKAQEEMGGEAFTQLTNDVTYYTEQNKKTVRDKIKNGTPQLKKLYNIVKNTFMKYENANYKLTNGYDQVYFNKQLVAKISSTPSKIKVFLALEPSNSKYAKFPHKDVSSKKIHAKTPYYTKCKSGLSIRRLEKLVADIAANNDTVINNEYKPFDFATSLKYGKAE